MVSARTVLLLLPAMLHACFNFPTSSVRWWVEETLPGKMPMANCCWIGAEIAFVRADPQSVTRNCVVGLQLPMQVTIMNPTGSLVPIDFYWTCKSPFAIRPVTKPGSMMQQNFDFTAGPASDVTAIGNELPLLTGNLKNVAFRSRLFNMGGTLDFDQNPSMPSDPCASGWVLKVWIKVCNVPSDFTVKITGGSTAGNIIGPPNMAPITRPRPEGGFNYAVTCGDVHFSTIDRVRYTFNAGGDYVYLKTKQPLFEMHVRQHMTKNGSVLAALALKDQITGDVIEAWWHGEGAHYLRLNGRKPTEVLNSLIDLDVENPGIFGKFILTKQSHEMVEISHAGWGTDFKLAVFYGGRASFALQVPTAWKTEGLAGNNNGNHKDDLIPRGLDTPLPMNATSLQVHKFGLSWKVRPHELQFENWMFVPPKDLVYKPLPIADEKLMKEAKELCLGDPSCTYDYISTGGDAMFAKKTMKDIFAHAFEKVHYVGSELATENF